MYGTYGAQAGYLSRDTYHNFINNYVRSSTSEKDVTFCPEVDMAIFKTDSPNPKFKGLALDATGNYYQDSVGKITTYAINGHAIYHLRSELKDCMFAFIDWNAAQGWLSWPSPNYYTGIKTNLLFFTKGQPTMHIWYYEHPYPEGVKSYNKTKPMRFEEFQTEMDWWGDETDGFKSRIETDQAWKVSIDEIKERNYNLDIKNPHVEAAANHDPEELLTKYADQQQEISGLRDQLKSILSEALKNGN